jgi:prolyl-tRNA synthetase
MNVWTGYGWKAMRLIDNFIREEFDGSEHQEVCFPLLIPETEFNKEAEHIKGFGSEVYWVTHAGDNELDVRLLLRPTSETAMYPIFSLWVRSHADLPLKTYQIVNVFRYETKQTRAFIRMREIHFFEAHTCHADFADAEKQISENLAIMKRLAKRLCLPYVMCKRPDWDKFAGAFYTIGLDSLMPTGRTLQMGSIHQYKENFSRPYEIKYEGEDGEHRYVHQTTFGMSERILGALVSIHADDKGIILPPDIAPIQVVIVPIYSKEDKDKVRQSCDDLDRELKGVGIRTKIDDRDLRPGNKFYDWELRGVPLRIEIGSRDIADNVITVARRDTTERSQIKNDVAVDEVRNCLDNLQRDLHRKVNEEMGNNIHATDELSEVVDSINSIFWCGEEDCGHQIEDITEMSILGEPVDKDPSEGNCIVCGTPTKKTIYIAKTY